MKTRQSICMLLLFGILLVPLVSGADKETGGTVDINTASAQELAAIPLINLELAEAIVAYREEVGGFVMIEELLQVDGFDRDLLLEVKSFFTLDGLSGADCTC